MCDLLYHNFHGGIHFPSSVRNLQVYKNGGFICKLIIRLVQGYYFNGCDTVLFGTIPKILSFLVPASSGVEFYTVQRYSLISTFPRCIVPLLSWPTFWALLDLSTDPNRVSKYENNHNISDLGI
jgi:hypothetical protein